MGHSWSLSGQESAPPSPGRDSESRVPAVTYHRRCQTAPGTSAGAPGAAPTAQPPPTARGPWTPTPSSEPCYPPSKCTPPSPPPPTPRRPPGLLASAPPADRTAAPHPPDAMIAAPHLLYDASQPLVMLTAVALPPPVSSRAAHLRPLSPATSPCVAPHPAGQLSQTPVSLPEGSSNPRAWTPVPARAPPATNVLHSRAFSPLVHRGVRL